MTNGIFLLLGGNLGDPKKIFSNALKLLHEREIFCKKTSSYYKTAAWGNMDQPDFLNQVIEVLTDLSPDNLLSKILEVEAELGRVREEKWGPRLIDIDILYYHHEIIKENKLIIPHPEIQNRRFTLAPLAEIAPDFIHPIYKKSQLELLALCNDPLYVEKI